MQASNCSNVGTDILCEDFWYGHNHNMTNMFAKAVVAQQAVFSHMIHCFAHAH